IQRGPDQGEYHLRQVREIRLNRFLKRQARRTLFMKEKPDGQLGNGHCGGDRIEGQARPSLEQLAVRRVTRRTGRDEMKRRFGKRELLRFEYRQQRLERPTL